MDIQFRPIGTIHTPYLPSLPTPHQPQTDAQGEFWLSVNPELTEAIEDLKNFRYIYVIYYLDQIKDPPMMKVSPPWANGAMVSLFASRSPRRPNPIGISVVEVKGIEENDILISGIDAYNGTPLLDIKPYMRSLDIKEDANDGWVETLEDRDHILSHLTGTPHHHEEEGEAHHAHHEHPNSGHKHGHGHEHGHGHGRFYKKGRGHQQK